jgi:carboxymethylenebutenolidase
VARTDEYEGLIAETIAITGAGGDLIHAYLARPLGPGPFPGMVLTHHFPGWSEWYKRTARRFAARGFATICPDLYCRVDHGDADDIGARVMAEGGVPDEQVIADADAANAYLRALPTSSGKVGVFGTCSGGRHAVLVACLGRDVDAAVDCWGGRVVMTEDDFNDRATHDPIAHTAQLQCPLLGLFGLEDSRPSPAQVDQHEQALREHGKVYEFHRYPDAGHGFFYDDRPNLYHAEHAADGWQKVWEFLARHLG